MPQYGGHNKLELPGKLFQVMFDHTVQVDQLTIDVVEHLDVRLLFYEVQCGSAAEWLHVAFVLGEQWQDMFSQASLAADPRNDW